MVNYLFLIIFLVPKVAKEELSKAKSQCEITDLSIQAEAARNEMESSALKMQKLIEDLQKAFKYKQYEIREEKRQLIEDIIRIRAGKPTNIEKDCEPIKMRAANMNTEIDIIMANNETLQAIGELMEDNESQEEIGAKKRFNGC